MGTAHLLCPVQRIGLAGNGLQARQPSRAVLPVVVMLPLQPKARFPLLLRERWGRSRSQDIEEQRGREGQRTRAPNYLRWPSGPSPR